MTISPELLAAYRYHRQFGAHWFVRNAETAMRLARQDISIGRKRYPADKIYPMGTWQPIDSTSHLSGAYASDLKYFNMELASDVISLRHKGWYTDDSQDATLQGIVVRLTRGRYVPGYLESNGEFIMLFPREMTDDKENAARFADRNAEIGAEHEREYNEAWQAGRQSSDLETEAAELRSDLRDFVATARKAREALRGHCDLQVVIMMLTDHVKERIAELREAISDLYRQRDKLRDGVPANLMSAFNEGRG